MTSDQKWEEYEMQRRALVYKGLTASEFEQEIRALIVRLGL